MCAGAMPVRASKDRAQSGRDPLDDFCSVCFSFLCEPVQWPDCSHHFCLLCSARLRLLRDNPLCPLCRAPAVRCRRVADLKVDRSLAKELRQRKGASRYDAQASRIRDEMSRIAAAGSPPPVELHLLCLGVWEFERGSEHGLQFTEPRDCEALRRVLASPQQRFGMVLAHHIERGARGRVAEIIGHKFLVNESEEEECVVVVQGGEGFVVREILHSANNRHNLHPVRGHVEMGEVTLQYSANRGAVLPPTLRRSQSSPIVNSSVVASMSSNPAATGTSAPSSRSTATLRRSQSSPIVNSSTVVAGMSSNPAATSTSAPSSRSPVSLGTAGGPSDDRNLLPLRRSPGIIRIADAVHRRRPLSADEGLKHTRLLLTREGRRSIRLGQSVASMDSG